MRVWVFFKVIFPIEGPFFEDLTIHSYELCMKFFLFLCLLTASAHSLADRCQGETPDLSLVLAADTSGSMDWSELKLQMEGYKEAFKSEQVINNLLGCLCVEVSVVFWDSHQNLVFGPAMMRSLEQIQEASDFFAKEEQIAHDQDFLIPETGRQNSRNSGTTLIDKALSFSNELLSNSNAHQKTIIVSGDGMITGSYSEKIVNYLREQRDLLHAQSIKVSGVTINSQSFSTELLNHRQSLNRPGITPNPTEYTSLTDFYRKEVITPYGFVDEATSFINFELSIEKSIARETCNMFM